MDSSDKVQKKRSSSSHFPPKKANLLLLPHSDKHLWEKVFLPPIPLQSQHWNLWIAMLLLLYNIVIATRMKNKSMRTRVRVPEWEASCEQTPLAHSGLVDSPPLLTEHINNNTAGLSLSPKHNYIIHHAFCAALTHMETWPSEPRWWPPSAGVITIDNV